MIKAASVGLGWWSDELAKSIQEKSRKIRIVSCYSKSKKKRINFSKKYKTNFHDSYTRPFKSAPAFHPTPPGHAVLWIQSFRILISSLPTSTVRRIEIPKPPITAA